MQLKGYFKDTNENAILTEEQIYKLANHKKWTPNKNRNTVLTYTEATPEELQFQRKNKNDNHLTT